MIYATMGTAKALNKNGVHAVKINKLEQESPNLLDLLLDHSSHIDLVIDTPNQGAQKSHDGFLIRRHAIETGVNVLTAIDTAEALITSLEHQHESLELVNIAEI